MKTTSKRIVFTLALLAMLAVACISHAEILPNRVHGHCHERRSGNPSVLQ